MLLNLMLLHLIMLSLDMLSLNVSWFLALLSIIAPCSAIFQCVFNIHSMYIQCNINLCSIISVWPTQPFGPRPPLGGIKIFQKEQPVMVMKPSLSIYIELYIINPFPNNKYWRTFFSFFYLRKDILPDFSLLGFKRKMIWIWKRKNFLGRRKKSLLIRPWSYIV